PRILNYFPQYKPNLVGDQYKDFYYIKLILSYIYRNPNKLKTIDNIVFKKYSEAYIYCLNIYKHPNNYYNKVVVPNLDKEFKEGLNKEL
ncbi:uncharacterized protein THITE_53229, partial [Thermothielavioides terrestris NRRL 8126]